MKADNSLGYIWSGRTRIKRIFFFTYQFNFYWFHNHVLPYIHHNGTADCEVLIVASRFDEKDLPSFGDQYELSAWCGFGKRFKLLFLDGRTIFHGKFIVCEYERKKNLLIGLGSANLTKSGWTNNLETWNWNARNSEAAIKNFLLFLSEGHLKESFLSAWITRLKKVKGTASYWLDGSERQKRDARAAIWNECLQRTSKIETLRITSPYFDDGSPDLLQEILDHFRPNKVEVVLDLSGALAGRKHLEQALALKNKAKVKYFSVIRNNLEPGHKIREWMPLHSKTIEFLDYSGNRCTIYGSANFTAAAWMRGNHEFVEVAKGNLKLPESVRLEQVKVSDIEQIIKTTLETEDDSVTPTQPMIYWATYDETNGVLELRHSEKAALVKNIKWEVEHDKRRNEINTPKSRSDVEKLKKVAADFLDPNAWKKPELNEQNIRWARNEDRIGIVPEHLAVVVTLTNGRVMRSPVIQSHPNFEERDLETGFPTDAVLDLDSLIGRGKPIVHPIKGRAIVAPDVEDEMDDETSNEESFTVPSLSSEAEYNHLPEAVKFTKALNQIKSKEERERIKKRIRSLIRIGHPSNELLLARSLLEVLDE